MKVRINTNDELKEYIELIPMGVHGFRMEVWREGEKIPYWARSFSDEEAGFFMRALDLLAGFR